MPAAERLTISRASGSGVGAFLLIEQNLLADIDGLFQEYIDTAAIEERAFAANAAGVVYMASRASGILYRHNVAIQEANTRPMVILEREAAMRAKRVLESGVPLTFTAILDIDRGGSYTAENVIADIPGRSGNTDVVLMGAHLDSWDLGGGTLDNGANVALIIDLARAMHELKLAPERTIRLVLWNGEEQGMIGSREYVRAHRADLDHIVLAGTIDTGCGQVTGWVTGARPDVTGLVDRLIAPAANLGPFTQVTDAMSGTDHFDFMLEGIPNVVANQAPATYGPNYHAASDQLEQCDLREQRLNAARVAALVWQAANDTARLPRQSRAEIQGIIDHTGLGAQMKAFSEYEDWARGSRGRAAEQVRTGGTASTNGNGRASARPGRASIGSVEALGLFDLASLNPLLAVLLADDTGHRCLGLRLALVASLLGGVVLGDVVPRSWHPRHPSPPGRPGTCSHRPSSASTWRT